MASNSQVFTEEQVQHYGVNEASGSSNVIQAPKIQNQDINTTAPSFKGVVQTQNGHWGAQVYANQKRIWLGTFKDKVKAAKAYDSASMKIRGSDFKRNFPRTTDHELSFQRQLSQETVINMIKDGSYGFKFLAFMKGHSVVEPNMLSPANKSEQLYGIKLFEKELTPSDVSDYNRFVIPKNFAETHFWKNNNAFDKEILCYDKFNAQWKFRLCHWKTSQTYVFTRGWSTFLKVKKLRVKDTIAFYSGNRKNNSNEASPSFMIDHIKYCNGIQGEVLEKERHLIQAMEEEVHVPDATEEEKDLLHKESSASKSQGVMLFGTRIA